MKIIAAASIALTLAACTGGPTHTPMMLGAKCPPPKLGEVPSGCQVKGATHYRTNAGSIRVIEVPNLKSVDAIRYSTRHEAPDSRGTDAGK